MAPSVSVLTGFDCLDFQDLAGVGGVRLGSAHNSRALSLSTLFLKLLSRRRSLLFVPELTIKRKWRSRLSEGEIAELLTN